MAFAIMSMNEKRRSKWLRFKWFFGFFSLQRSMFRLLSKRQKQRRFTAIISSFNWYPFLWIPFYFWRRWPFLVSHSIFLNGFFLPPLCTQSGWRAYEISISSHCTMSFEKWSGIAKYIILLLMNGWTMTLLSSFPNKFT